MERLQKVMAQAGLGSRRENEALIAAGKVMVNGRMARLGDKADPSQDRIEVNGRLLQLKAPLLYIALHKPKGVLSSTEDELAEGRPTVRALIPLPGHLYPVGRLDKESEGLMLLTNDGVLAHRLTHPRYEHEKTYHVLVAGSVTEEKLAQWRRGVLLEEQMTLPAKVTFLEKQGELTWLKVVLREGRKRQIRRVANLLGLEVRQLVRQQIGSLVLGQLKVGEWRHLTADEVTRLQLPK